MFLPATTTVPVSSFFFQLGFNNECFSRPQQLFQLAPFSIGLTNHNNFQILQSFFFAYETYPKRTKIDHFWMDPKGGMGCRNIFGSHVLQKVGRRNPKCCKKWVAGTRCAVKNGMPEHIWIPCAAKNGLQEPKNGSPEPDVL